MFLSFKHSNTFDKTMSIISGLVFIIIFAYIIFGNISYENGNYYFNDSSNNMKPISEIQYKLNTAPYKPGKLIYTKTLIFSNKYLEKITTKDVTKDTGFDKDQLLFLDNGITSHFQADEDSLYILTKEDVEYKLGILCSGNLENLKENISNYSLYNLNLSFLENSNKLDKNSSVCVVFPNK